MPKYKFKEAERQAVFTVHGPHCYICNTLVTMKTIEVDHVIPESLGSEPAKLSEALKRFACPPCFNINSFENWLPACRPCNGKKLELEWWPSPLIQMHLQRAVKKAKRCSEIAATLVSNRKLHHALSVLKQADEEGELTDEIKSEILPLLRFNLGNRDPAFTEERIYVTPKFSISALEILRDDGLLAVARGPYGIGGGPSLSKPAPAAVRCVNCGSTFVNGARCIVCGEMDD